MWLLSAKNKKNKINTQIVLKGNIYTLVEAKPPATRFQWTKTFWEEYTRKSEKQISARLFTLRLNESLSIVTLWLTWWPKLMKVCEMFHLITAGRISSNWTLNPLPNPQQCPLAADAVLMKNKLLWRQYQPQQWEEAYHFSWGTWLQDVRGKPKDLGHITQTFNTSTKRKNHYEQTWWTGGGSSGVVGLD